VWCSWQVEECGDGGYERWQPRSRLVYGCGWDYDYVLCPCGYEDELLTSTLPDDLENPDDRAADPAKPAGQVPDEPEES
jgi:hypothetical protein